MRPLPPLALSLLLTACGGGGGGGPTGSTSAPPPVVTRGTLAGAPAAVPVAVHAVPLATVTPTVFQAWLEAQQPGTTLVTGTPTCAISTWRITYHTVGAAGEATTASAAVMVPSGGDPACAGPRPVLLYAHATSVLKAFDMADLGSTLSTEPRLVAATWAAHGYLVVAPNYAGYAGSTLGYTPYLVAQAQSADMLDALRAARSAFATLGASASDKLFLAGYSQGGYAALATLGAMQRLPAEFKVRATAALSGPYALLQLGDTLFGGAPTVGATSFLPLLTTAAQHAGAGVYANPSELYEDRYAAGIDSLLPGTRTVSELTGVGKLPTSAVFAQDSQPQLAGHAAGFGPDNLVRSSYRAAYLADALAHPCAGAATPLACAPGQALRRFLRDNDLRNFAPAGALLLCGGHADPTVPYANTLAEQDYLNATGAAAGLTVLDLDQTPDRGAPFRAEQLAFLVARAALAHQAQQAGQLADEAVAANYHAGLVAPFCLQAARAYFDAK
jgi:dienelactone hydrolase